MITGIDSVPIIHCTESIDYADFDYEWQYWYQVAWVAIFPRFQVAYWILA